jgi:hypothetical protein
MKIHAIQHLHTDHAGGLDHPRENEILFTRREVEFAAGLRGRLRGYPNARWPAWFDPIQLELEPVPFGPFPQSRRLTEAGDVILVPLPGHTPGVRSESSSRRTIAHDPGTGTRLDERRIVQAGAVNTREAAALRL